MSIVLVFANRCFGLCGFYYFCNSIKTDQLDVTRFIISLFTAQHVSNVSASIFRSLRLTVVSLCRLKHCFSLHKDTTPPQPNHTVTPTHIEPEQYNTWNKSTINRKFLKMDVLTFETCWVQLKHCFSLHKNTTQNVRPSYRSHMIAATTSADQYTGISIALTKATHWYTHTRLRAPSRLVT